MSDRQTPKATVLRALIEELKRMAVRATEEQQEAQSEANSHVGAMASRYDTFKEEAQYLAAGHQLRVTQLRTGVNECTALLKAVELRGPDEYVAMGSLVHIVDEDGEERWYLVAPAGGGTKITQDQVTMTVIGGASPVAKMLMGKTTGDEVELLKKIWSIEEIC